MKKVTFIFSLFALVFLPASPAFACDIDNDGIDDPTAYEEDDDGDWTWRSLQSSDSMVSSVAGFGSTSEINKSFPCSGRYLGSSVASNHCHIDSLYFWNVRKPDTSVDQLNFGRERPAYLTGADLDGDGDVDLGKTPVLYNKLTYRNYVRPFRLNMAFNETDGTDAFQGTAPTGTGIFGKSLSPIVALDANGDGAKDICMFLPLRVKTRFRMNCKSATTLARVKRRNVASMYAHPLALENASGADSLLMFQKVKKTGSINFRIIPMTGDVIKRTVYTTGQVLVGDWRGLGYDQIGILLDDGQLIAYDYNDESTEIFAMPDGTPHTCDNNFGNAFTAKRRIVNSKNICKKIFFCPRGEAATPRR